MGKPPTICHQHLREFIHIARNCSCRGRQTFHTSATSPCLIHYPWQAQKHAQVPPQPRETELCCPTEFCCMEAGWRGSGTVFHLERMGTGQGRRLGGVPRALPTYIPHLGSSKCRPVSWDAGRARGDPAPASFPPQLQAPSQEKLCGRSQGSPPRRSWPCLAAEHACSDGRWVVGLREQRVPSAG